MSEQSQLQALQSDESLISVKNLSFRYFGAEANVLDHISLDIAHGDIAIIAGLSGSGKSTLLRAINGLIPHQHSGDYAGSVFVDGLEVAKTEMSQLATKVGYIFQNPENQIFMFSVERDIAFGLENLGYPRSEIRERVDTSLDTLGIADLANRAPHELSDGQKQRVAIAGVLAMQPSILIFDEPTSLLDPFTASNLIEVIRNLHDRLKITVLIVEHRLDLVSKIANRLIVIDAGRKIFDGTPRSVLYSPNVDEYGVTEPSVVRLAKLLSLGSQEHGPLSPTELEVALTGKN
jgi:energy-coupling factor transporter ATP-binding protein EcfA2